MSKIGKRVKIRIHQKDVEIQYLKFSNLSFAVDFNDPSYVCSPQSTIIVSVIIVVVLNIGLIAAFLVFYRLKRKQWSKRSASVSPASSSQLLTIAGHSNTNTARVYPSAAPPLPRLPDHPRFPRGPNLPVGHWVWALHPCTIAGPRPTLSTSEAMPEKFQPLPLPDRGSVDLVLPH